MQDTLSGPRTGTLNPTSQKSATITRDLLACGVVAGPVYVLVGALQILIRPGFDITRHDLSLMSNGEMGWIQIANFVVTGLLTVACARLGNRGWAAYSMATGVLFFAAFFGIAAGTSRPGSTMTFVILASTAAVILAWTWVSTLAARLFAGKVA